MLLASCVIHASLAAFLLAPRSTAAAAPAQSPDARELAEDRWTGETLVADLEVATETGPAAGAEAGAAAEAAAEAAAAAVPAATATAAAAGVAAMVPVAATRPRRRRSAPSSNLAPASASGEGRSAPAAAYGAEGPPGVRSLARAFTRAIAPANQADATWSSLAPGSAGTIDVTLTLDDDGHLEASRPPSGAPCPLASLLTRTIALLRGGTYAARGPSAKVVLRLTVRVLDVEVPKVEGGNVELGWAFEAGKGRASFLRDGGRRVDVTVAQLE